MKRFLVILSFLFIYNTPIFAQSITEELTQLNNLFKEGAITKEEFSKAKSILLKTNNDQEVEKNKVKKPEVKKKSS